MPEAGLSDMKDTLIPIEREKQARKARGSEVFYAANKAFRNGGPADILSDTHIEPLNNWARFLSQWKHELVDMSADGGWILLGSGSGNSLWLSGSHHVHYDMFLVPANVVAVFEGSLNMYYSGFKGEGLTVPTLPLGRT